MKLSRIPTYCYRYVFGRKIFFPMNKFLFNLSTRGMGVGNCLGEDRLFSDFYRRNIPATGIIVDVGAGSGAYLSRIRDFKFYAKIFAFEPNPSSYQLLHARWNDNSYTKTFPIGLGNKPDTLKLYDVGSRKDSGAASIHGDIFDQIHGIKDVVSHEITIDTLDNVTTREGIAHISLLKIDTEGNELAVLQGASNLLSNKAIDMIQFEFNSMNVCSRVFFRDFWNILPNYDFYRVLTDGLLKIESYDPLTCEILWEQNFMANRRESGVNV